MEPISVLATGAGEAVAFYGFAGLAIAAAFLMVIRKNPVASVLWLVLCFVGLAGLFVVLQAYFIAVIQILVYAGAIMVLFLFVVMLLDLRVEDLGKLTLPRIPIVGAVAAVLFLVAMVAVVTAVEPFWDYSMSEFLAPRGAAMPDSVKAIGRPLFTDWLLPFEVTSVLLLAAIVGAVALTRKRL